MANYFWIVPLFILPVITDQEVLQVKSSIIRIPCPIFSDSEDIDHFRVFVSRDFGKTWNLHGNIKPSGNTVFSAAQDGSYWFATQSVSKKGPNPAVTGRKPVILKTYVNSSCSHVIRLRQTEDEIAKKIKELGNLVGRDEKGHVNYLALSPRKTSDFIGIDFSVLRNLKGLTICGNNASDRLLLQLMEIPAELTSLCVFCAPVSDDFLNDYLRKQKSLRLVILAETKTSDNVMSSISGLKELICLSLNGTKITDNGLKKLARTRLESLNLCNTVVSDVGLMELKTIVTLQSLRLEKTSVSDVGVEHLFTLRNLRSLSIDSTNVTEAGKNAIKAAMPNVRFHRIMGNNSQ